MKLGKKFRKNLIEGIVNRMEFEDVTTLECAIQGYDVDTICRKIGEMSSNQWRACLVISLNQLIFKEK